MELVNSICPLVGGSTVWLGHKAGTPRRFLSVECAIIKSVQIPLVYLRLIKLRKQKKQNELI